VLRDDQSKPELTSTIYEQLITADKVDMIQSPYATGAILAAMGVAQRYNKVLLHNSSGIPKLAKYDMQFQTAGVAFDPENVWPNLIFDAAAKLPKPPKAVAILASKVPSVHFISVGARDVLKKRGRSPRSASGRQRDEASRSFEDAVSDERMHRGVEVDQVAEGLVNRPATQT
jgi:branched-chain amino acid transport system substrate-binding protein